MQKYLEILAARCQHSSGLQLLPLLFVCLALQCSLPLHASCCVARVNAFDRTVGVVNLNSTIGTLLGGCAIGGKIFIILARQLQFPVVVQCWSPLLFSVELRHDFFLGVLVLAEVQVVMLEGREAVNLRY